MKSVLILNGASVLLTALLAACGGGGGGSSPSTPEPVKMSALAAPAQWPENFKSVTINQADLVSTAELAQTANDTKAIFIQIWYLNLDQQRQPLAVLTLHALTQMEGKLKISKVPASVKVLKSEVYTANGSDQLTLALKEIGV